MPIRLLYLSTVLRATDLLLRAKSLRAEGPWPQWRGPNRDDYRTETGLIQELPEGGPPRLWLFENCGAGYSGPAIVGDRLYILGGSRRQ